MLLGRSLVRHCSSRPNFRTVDVGGSIRLEIQLGSHSSGETIGTGGVIWDSGVTLARFMHEEGVVAGKRVCDLGSGTGIGGLAAAVCGAESVLLTDILGLELLARNVCHNSLEQRVSVARLEWGNSADAESVLALSPGRHYDIITASDVLYDLPSAVKLLRTMRELAAADTVAYIAAPSKNCARILPHTAPAFYADRVGEFVTPKEEGFRAPGSKVSIMRLRPRPAARTWRQWLGFEPSA